MQETASVTSLEDFPPRRLGRKYPTKATKLEFLEFVAGYQGADVVTATQRLHLSPSGVRGKFRRLVRQGLLETIPDTYGRTKAWQLTKNGRRDLAYLREAVNYAGTKSKLIESLRAEVDRLKAENNRLQKLVENTSGILQKGAGAANENVALKRAPNESRAENKRLKAQIVTYRQTLALRTMLKR